MSVSEAYDVIIVGGGSAGFAAALEAERADAECGIANGRHLRECGLCAQ